jgi:hypothetical protein
MFLEPIGTDSDSISAESKTSLLINHFAKVMTNLLNEHDMIDIQHEILTKISHCDKQKCLLEDQLMNIKMKMDNLSASKLISDIYYTWYHDKKNKDIEKLVNKNIESLSNLKNMKNQLATISLPNRLRYYEIMNAIKMRYKDIILIRKDIKKKQDERDAKQRQFQEDEQCCMTEKKEVLTRINENDQTFYDLHEKLRDIEGLLVSQMYFNELYVLRHTTEETIQSKVVHNVNSKSSRRRRRRMRIRKQLLKKSS